MYFLPIDIQEVNNSRFLDEPECKDVLDIFINHYKKAGFDRPWIAYFVADENQNIVGGGGFKGKPQNGKVEISYGTFKSHEGKGVGSEICRQLVSMALNTDSSVKITARTLPDNIASKAILEKNGFVCMGYVLDEDDGDVLEWEYNRAIKF